MRRTLRIALAGLLTGILTTSPLAAEPKKETTKAGAESSSSVPEAQLGLARGNVSETLTPDPVVPESSDPGTKPLPSRWNRIAPPMIPHSVADALPITRDANACVDCHLVDKKEKGEPTPIPTSHLAVAKGDESAAVAGPRWICVSCHAPGTDAKPLPASTRQESGTEASRKPK